MQFPKDQDEAVRRLVEITDKGRNDVAVFKRGQTFIIADVSGGMFDGKPLGQPVTVDLSEIDPKSKGTVTLTSRFVDMIRGAVKAADRAEWAAEEAAKKDAFDDAREALEDARVKARREAEEIALRKGAP